MLILTEVSVSIMLCSMPQLLLLQPSCTFDKEQPLTKSAKETADTKHNMLLNSNGGVCLASFRFAEYKF
jgi:hypothetical protein